MNNQSIYKRKVVYDYAHAILAFLMPLIVKGFPILIVVSALLGVSYFFVSYKKVGKLSQGYLLPFTLVRDGFRNILKSKGPPFLMLALFLVYLVSYFYSSDLKTAHSKLILNSCLIYFPLIFVLTKWDKVKLFRVMRFFIVGCVLQVVISFITAYISSGNGFDVEEFTYMNLSFNAHPSYAALMVVVGVVFTGLLLVDKFIQRERNGLTIYLFLVGLFSFYIILLSSKAGIISLLFAYLVFAFVLLKTKIIAISKSLLFFFIAGGLICSVLFFSPVAKTRFKEIGKADQTNVKKPSSSQIRLILWSASLNSIKASPFFGYGIGDAKAPIQKRLKEGGEEYIHGLNYNSHNQYLDVLLMAGLPALVLLIGIIFTVPIGFKSVYWIPSLLVFIVAFNLLVESMLERQVGSIVIVWLFCLLYSAKDIFISSFTIKKTEQ